MASSPAALLSYRREGDTVVPRYLDARDHGWIRLLVAEYDRFSGQPRRALDERLRMPLPFASPPRKRLLVMRLLDRSWRTKVRAALPPVEARSWVFMEAARAPAPADDVLARVAACHGVSPADLVCAMWADLPSERRLVAPRERLSENEIELRANLMLVQCLLKRSMRVVVELWGNARAVVRQAKLRGLICTVGSGQPPSLAISGPLSLFRRTLIYGRHLGELVPALAYCNRFVLRAELVLPDGPATLVVKSGDPIFPAAPPRLYDSHVEARLARDLAKVAPQWDVVREPEPVAAGGSLLFPDFALLHRAEPERRYLVEVMGFWTPAYVARKLERLRQARLRDFVLCLERDCNCGDAELPAEAVVVPFHRRIDAAELARVLERLRAERPCANPQEPAAFRREAPQRQQIQEMLRSRLAKPQHASPPLDFDRSS